MEHDMEALIKDFTRIKKMGWVESMRKGSTGIGYTFENLLNKEENSLEIPDYGSIEIKTKNKLSKMPVRLFCATPDGDKLFPTKIIREKFSYPSKKDKDIVVFNGIINAKSFTKIGNRYLFKLKVDRISKTIRLIVIDINCKLICDDISWSFDMLRDKLSRKLTYLAIINAERKFEHNAVFFHYQSINFYQLKDFDTFISLIEDGIVKICFAIGTYKNGPNIGKTHDHGIMFEINENDILKLYDEIRI